MKKLFIWLLFISILLVACANPLNRATYDRYREQGFKAEEQGDYGTAEISFYRAAENVEWGNLGPDLESDALYNLGRVKQIVGKLDEAEILLKKALIIDEQRYGKSGFMTSYPMGELAITLYKAKKYDEGVLLLIRLEPIILQNKHKYTAQAKQANKKLYKKYAEELSKQNRQEEAKRLEGVSSSF